MRWSGIIITFFLCIVFIQKVDSQTQFNKFENQKNDGITISKIIIQGNKTTRDKIILREVEFTQGEQIKQGQLDSLIVKSSQNLMNRSIFNFATISKQIEGNECIINIDVTERWYIWPIPIIDFGADRNFNAWWETRDFSRLNYGIDLRVENFRGRMEYLNFIVQAGYDKKLAAKWTIPYLTEKQNFGMSLYGGYQVNKEVAYSLEDNKPVFYEPVEGNAQEWGFASVDLTIRQKFNFLHTITLGYDHYNFADSLVEYNPDFAYYGATQSFLSLSYQYKIDFRDYKPYPLVGYYFDAGISKQGLAILSDEVNLFSLSFVFDQYINLYKRWFFAYSFTGLFYNKSTIPYYLKPAIGYKEMEMRGYEYYVIPGQYFGMFKSNVKFEIIPRKVHRIKWIKTEKFGKIFYALYANLFFDLGYAYDQLDNPENQLSNQFLWGTGLGIDFVTYYDLVIRFEYTLNKQKDHGFYINLVAPI